jgi:FkbM family methyltransferase
MEFLDECFIWAINKQLHKRGNRHILENRKQLIVFSFDHIAHTINLNGVYEKDDLDTFFQWMRSMGVDFSNATALDIGANIGNHSLYFSDHFKKVISFEPNPRTYKVLALNAELVSNVVCHNVGLSDKTGNAVLAVNPANIGGSSITDGKPLHPQDIKLVELDSFEKYDNVKLLKIDVEGHEYKALSGARKLIKEQMPIILFEQHISDFENGHSPVVSLLKEIGYKDFATMKKYPRSYGSKMKRFFLVPLFRAAFGESTRIENITDIKPDFYSFVIALPDWIKEKSPIEP